jgi:hypothetical protein
MLYQLLLSVVCILFGYSIQTVLNSPSSKNIFPASDLCGDHERQELIITPSFTERMNGKLEVSTLSRAVNVFRKCGAVAINGAVSAEAIDDFKFHLFNMISPLLESRDKVKAEALYKSWNELSTTTKEEPFLASGEAIRERQSGRLDVLLPHTLPFNSTDVVLNRYTIDILNKIFDDQLFELKSVHGVISLPGTTSQKWHRDDGPLFPVGMEEEDTSSKSMKSINVYAVNAFIALSDVKLANGPTEYMLGSHLESNKQMKETLSLEHQAVAFEWPKGSLVLMDYRTVHRGGANTLEDPRSLAMLVYGRLWWRDAVNYMG